MTNEIPPAKIALILDGQVVDVLHTDERLAAIFLSSPEIIDVTEHMANDKRNLVRATWDGSTFTPVADEPAQVGIPAAQVQQAVDSINPTAV